MLVSLLLCFCSHAVCDTLCFGCLLLVSGGGVHCETDEAQSCRPTVLASARRSFLGGVFREHELSVNLFITTVSLFLPKRSIKEWNPTRAPCCKWEIILVFIPAFTPCSAVSHWAVSLLVWNTFAHQCSRANIVLRYLWKRDLFYSDEYVENVNLMS